MIKVRLNKLATLGAAIALTFLPSFVTKADGPIDLKSEAQTIAGYLDDLGKVAHNVSDLKQRGSLQREEFDKTKNEVDGLKRRLADVERAVAGMIRKLKDNQDWENLDEQLAHTLTDTKAQEILRKCGGAKRCLEAGSRLVSDANALDKLLDPLRARVQARGGDYLFSDGADFGVRMMPATYRFAFGGGDSIACRASRAVMIATGTHKSVNRAYCLCVEMTALDESLSQCMSGLS